MLKNKKKLRRMERNTPGYAVKTAQSLVLAGALVLGGVGVASAADLGSDATGWNVQAGGSLTGISTPATVIAAGQELILNSASVTKNVYITGAATYATNNNSITITGGAAVPVNLAIGNAGAATVINAGSGTVKVSGGTGGVGTLEIKDKSSVITTGGIAIGNFGVLKLSAGAGAAAAATVTGDVTLDGTSATLIVAGGNSAAEANSNYIGGNLNVTKGAVSFTGATASFLTVKEDITIGAESSFAVGTAGNAAVAGVSNEVTAKNVTYSATGATALTLGADGGNGGAGVGGNGTLTVTNDFTATTALTIAGGKGGNGDGTAVGGNGGDSILKVTGTMTAEKAFMLVGGAAGNKNTNEGGNGGAANLEIIGTGAFGALNIEGGAAGTGGSNGIGGNAIMSVGNALGSPSSLTATSITLKGNSGGASQQGKAELSFQGGSLNVAAGTVSLEGLSAATDAGLKIGNGGQTIGTTANIGTLQFGTANDKFGAVALAGNAAHKTTVTLNSALALGTNGSVNIGANATLKIMKDQTLAIANVTTVVGGGNLSLGDASSVLQVVGTLKLTGATPTLNNNGSIIANVIDAATVAANSGNAALTIDGNGNNGNVILLGDGNGNSGKFINANGLTLANSGNLFLGSTDTNVVDSTYKQGGTFTKTITPTNGDITVAAGDWTITNNDAALNLGANSTLRMTGGKLNVSLGTGVGNTFTLSNAANALRISGGTLDLTGSAGMVVAANAEFALTGGSIITKTLDASAGDKSTIVNGTVEVTGTAANSYKAGATKVEVGNLGVLKVDFSQAWNKVTSALVATGTTDVIAGGTLMLTGGSGYNFTTVTLGTLKGVINNGAGLLNIGAATITGVTADGSVKYTDVSGVTSNDLLTSTATGTAVELANASGGFKNLEITGAVPTVTVAITPTGTLQLAGSANGVQLVAGLGAQKAVITVGADKALIFGVVGNNLPQTKGTLTGDVNLTAGSAGNLTNFNAVNGDFDITGTLTGANNTAVNLSAANVTVDKLAGAATTAFNLVDGSFVVNTGNAVVGAVTLENGGLFAADISTGNGDLTTGTVTTAGTDNVIAAGGDLTVAGFTNVGTAGTAAVAGTVNNTSVFAGGDMTVTNSGIKATGSTFNVVGNLTASNDQAITAGNSILNVGGLLSTGNGAVTLTNTEGTIGQLITTGAVSLTDGSDITLSATDTVTKASSVASLLVGEAVNTANAGSGSAANLNVNGKLTVTGNTGIFNGSTVNVAELDALGLVRVGSEDDTKGSSLIIGKLSSTGTGTIFVDPAAENSIAQLKNTVAPINQTFIAGKNGIVSFGEHGLDWAKAQIAESGMTKPSVLVLASNVTLTGGAQILVGKDYDAAGKWDIKNNPTVAADTYGLAVRGNSLIVVDGTNWAKNAVGITLNGAVGTATRNVLIEKGTGLHLVADVLKAGETRTLVSGINQAEQVAGTALNGQTQLVLNGDTSTNYMLIGVGNVVYTPGATSTGFITGGTTLIDANSVLPKMSHSMGSFLNGMAVNEGFNSESDNVGIRFVSRALDRRFLGINDPTKAAATIEGAAQMAAVAGVQSSTMGAANAASGAVTTRTSFAQPLMDMTKAVAVHQDNDGTLSLDTGLNAGNGMKNGLGVWIMPLYQSNSAWGQKAGNFKSGMTSDLGGIALGADYTINDMFRFGAAFNVGAGYGQSTGDFNKTENRFNFWGVNLYGGWTMNNFGLSADVGYTSTFNAVKQDTPASLQMGNLKSDVTSSALQAGLKAEYKLETSVVDIIPHVGVRYMGLATDGYDVKSHGTVFSVERDFQSIWTFPIGVAFSKTITSDSGWMFKPMVDLSVVPAAGDIKAKSKTSIPGVGGQAEMKMQVVDTVTFDGGLGFEVGKDNLSFGLNYNVQASEHRTGHGVFGTLRYEF